jgi:hypothetical protein
MDEQDRELVARYFRDKLKSEERVGCPGSDVLEQIAAGAMPPSSPWYDHLTGCGPCFRQTEEIRRLLQAKAMRRRRRLILLMAAILVVGAVLLLWRT